MADRQRRQKELEEKRKKLEEYKKNRPGTTKVCDHLFPSCSLTECAQKGEEEEINDKETLAQGSVEFFV